MDDNKNWIQIRVKCSSEDLETVTSVMSMVDNGLMIEDYSDVDKLIKAGRIDDAQQALDQYEERHAEWHYLQAVIYYKKNWGNECKKQMEIALMKDPANAKYKDSYDKLCKEMEFKSKSFTSGNEANQNEQPKYEYTTEEKQLGGNDCMNSCCECLACNMLLNCCCNCH
jgi:hypothetical protein